MLAGLLISATQYCERSLWDGLCGFFFLRGFRLMLQPIGLIFGMRHLWPICQRGFFAFAVTLTRNRDPDPDRILCERRGLFTVNK